MDPNNKRYTPDLEEIYNGYKIQVFAKFPNWLAGGGIGFKIFEVLENGKHKNRRESTCNQYTGKRNEYGEKLYTSFESMEQALDRAKNYIDHHIKPWSVRLQELGRTK